MVKERYLSKGKRTDNTEWIVGMRSNCLTGSHGVIDAIQVVEDFDGRKIPSDYPVLTDTIGQCTGLSAIKSYRGDRPEDLLIFEGDIVKDRLDRTFRVFWSDWFCDVRLFILDGKGDEKLIRNRDIGAEIFYWIYPENDLEIIGNIHDNPELLNGGAEID